MNGPVTLIDQAFAKYMASTGCTLPWDDIVKMRRNKFYPAVEMVWEGFKAGWNGRIDPLSDSEIRHLLETPDSLVVLAEYHEYQETLADAADAPESAKFHKEKALYYRNWGSRRLAAIDNGE